MGGQKVHLVVKAQVETDVVLIQGEAGHELVQSADHQVIQGALVDGGGRLNIGLLLQSDWSWSSQCLRLLVDKRTPGPPDLGGPRTERLSVRCPLGEQHRLVLAHGAGLETVQDLAVHVDLALGGVEGRHPAGVVRQLGEGGGEVAEVREGRGDRPLIGDRRGGAEHRTELADRALGGAAGEVQVLGLGSEVRALQLELGTGEVIRLGRVNDIWWQRKPSEEGGGGGAPDRSHSGGRVKAGSEARPRSQESRVRRGEVQVATGLSSWPCLSTPDVCNDGWSRGQ